ncbi:hypothetical protein EJ377_04455 [Chryseobacterium arthrosphaerae]|uniref:DUF6443 domain-containing protein n=1 Tax=Chryseobacterium arthrosphaerae TaxID=651561 RepID=A0A432DZ93_9FLAO|nr:hypothetical protein EJ377_04455 [Chryseobacterium arthrosphaerae]
MKNAETVQYFDGLGRPKQGIAVKASPTGKDIVSYIEYDATEGRLKLSAGSSIRNAERFNLYFSLGNASSVYGSEKIYSESILDYSPLNRVLQQTSIGTEWNTNLWYWSMIQCANEVYQYVVTTTWKMGQQNIFEFAIRTDICSQSVI